MNNSSAVFCDLENFSKKYAQVHGTLSFVVCVFGSVANILNICVLTTKEMRWPTNLILTGLALADLLVMLEYIPFTFFAYMNKTGPKHVSNYTYKSALFVIFHALFSQVFHFISVCLTVILAIWRYVTITNPHKSRVWCSMRRTFLVIVLTYIICPLICFPIFLSLKIQARSYNTSALGEILTKQDLLNYSDPLSAKLIYRVNFASDSYKTVSFWLYSVVLKLVPCILLTHLSWRLISVLLETKKRRRLLLNSSLHLDSFGNVKPGIVSHKKGVKDRQADRTSSMLLAVLLLFLLTEFPQAILGLLSAILGHDFLSQCYLALGDALDILALTNSAINFILYCTMSRQFRSTFREVFTPRILNKWMPLPANQSTTEKNGEKTQLSQV